LKVLLLTHERGLRGGERQLLALAQGLVARGHGVVLGGPSGIALGQDFPGLHRSIPMANALDLRGVFAIRAAVRAVQPDVVHAFTARTHGLARWSGASPLVVTRAVSFPSSGRKYRSGVERFIAVSQASARALEAGGADPARIRIIPVGVATRERDLSERDVLRARVQAPFVLAAAGALEEAKGFEVLLQALASLPQVGLLLAGEGGGRPQLESQVRALGLERRVVLLGQLPSIALLLGAADALVMPSRSEGMPLTLLEAMSAGVPVVATRAGGIPEVITDGEHGLLVKVDAADELAAAILRLGDRALAAQLGERARVRAAAFTPEVMVERTLAVYGEIVGGRSSGGAG
jgi:glycosyltransferase involved in cell wall biosynthesis